MNIISIDFSETKLKNFTALIELDDETR